MASSEIKVGYVGVLFSSETLWEENERIKAGKEQELPVFQSPPIRYKDSVPDGVEWPTEHWMKVEEFWYPATVAEDGKRQIWFLWKVDTPEPAKQVKECPACGKKFTEQTNVSCNGRELCPKCSRRAMDFIDFSKRAEVGSLRLVLRRVLTGTKEPVLVFRCEQCGAKCHPPTTQQMEEFERQYGKQLKPGMVCSNCNSRPK